MRERRKTRTHGRTLPAFWGVLDTILSRAEVVQVQDVGIDMVWLSKRINKFKRECKKQNDVEKHGFVQTRADQI